MKDDANRGADALIFAAECKAVYGHLPSVGLEQRGDDVYSGRFSRAVGPKEGKKRSPADRKIDPPDGLDLPISFAQTAHLNGLFQCLTSSFCVCPAAAGCTGVFFAASTAPSAVPKYRMLFQFFPAQNSMKSDGVQALRSGKPPGGQRTKRARG